jgi:tetratricopeptide (TPR) repeat protein
MSTFTRGGSRRRPAPARVMVLAAAMASLWACSAQQRGGAGGRVAPGDDLIGQIESMAPEAQLSYLRDLEEKGRHDAVLYFHMGNSYYGLEQLDSAIVYYGDAIAADSSFTKAWVNMGLAYDGQKQSEASRRAFEEALKVNPNDVLALCHLGFNYFTHGQADKAMTYYAKALSVDPNSAQAHYNLGLAFADAKLFGEALIEWQKVIEVDPDGELGKTAAENVQLIKTYMELDQ